MNKADTSNMKARFETSKKFLRDGLKQSRKIVWAAKRRVILDVWIHFIRLLLNIKCRKRFMTQIPATGYQNFLTDVRYSAQTGCKEFPIRKNESDGQFLLVNDDEEGKLHVCKISYLLSILGKLCVKRLTI